MPAVAQGPALLRRRHRQPAWPRPRARPGPRGRPVPVGVGLDHCAQRGRRGEARQQRALWRTAAEVDLGPGRARPRPGGHVAAEAGRSATAHSDSHGRGGRPGRRPRGPRRGPSAAARPWTWAARPAAGAGATPRATKAPMAPDRTSPVPAVARRGEPAVASEHRPAGSATTVVGPLQQHHRPAVAAARPRRRRDPVGARGAAGQAGELAVVGGEQTARRRRPGGDAAPRTTAAMSSPVPRATRGRRRRRPGGTAARRPRRAPGPRWRRLGPARGRRRGPGTVRPWRARAAAQPSGRQRAPTASPAGRSAGSAPGMPRRTMPAPAR